MGFKFTACGTRTVIKFTLYLAWNLIIHTSRLAFLRHPLIVCLTKIFLFIYFMINTFILSLHLAMITTMSLFYCSLRWVFFFFLLQEWTAHKCSPALCVQPPILLKFTFTNMSEDATMRSIWDCWIQERLNLRLWCPHATPVVSRHPLVLWGLTPLMKKGSKSAFAVWIVGKVFLS